MKYHLVLEPFQLNHKQYIVGEYISVELILQNPHLTELVSEKTYDLILG